MGAESNQNSPKVDADNNPTSAIRLYERNDMRVDERYPPLHEEAVTASRSDAVDDREEAELAGGLVSTFV